MKAAICIVTVVLLFFQCWYSIFYCLWHEKCFCNIKIL